MTTTLLPGPTGLGTSASRLAVQRTTTEPELYCPPAVRDDPALGEEVNGRLIAWAQRVGIYSGRLERLRGANFGRLMMLTHPDSDDPDRLTAAGKCAVAEWATDDHYCDDEDAGAVLELLGSRLAIANAVVDPAPLPDPYAAQLDQAARADPVLVALRTSLEHVARYATWSQLARLRHELANLWVGYCQEASWRATGQTPHVWEYLVNRTQNNFLPCMALIDVVGGYALTSTEYAEPRTRRAIGFAALASVIVNDLYSMAKERRSSSVDFNLPTLIAIEEKCTPEEGVRRATEIHDGLVHRFEAEAAAVSVLATPAMRRFLAGVWAWLGGSREWHRTTDRYREPTR